MLRSRSFFLGGYLIASGVLAWTAACSSSSPPGFDSEGDAGTSSSSGGSSGGGSGGGSGSSSGGGGGNSFDGGLGLGTGDAQSTPTQEASVTVTTTIYANTDSSLYSMDPKTNAVTLIGTFAGVSDSSTDSTITDVAVNAAGDVYVNTESVIYKATLPATLPGTVQLTKVATISATSGTRFYALAFTPAGALGANENLVGGDGNGNLWSIDPSTGATIELGNFGSDPTNSANVMALSGDLVFYTDATGAYQGLATIRSCKSGSTTCNKADDYLAGVNMTALATAFSSGTPAATLNNGIYGGSMTTLGNGIGHGEVFGLGAVEGNVIGFSRYQNADGGPEAPALWSIDTSTASTSGTGTVIPASFSFTNGWSGAGVTSKVTVVIPPPPPPPPAPK